MFSEVSLIFYIIPLCGKFILFKNMLSLNSLLKMESPWSQDCGTFWDYGISEEVIQALITGIKKWFCSVPVLCAITQLLSECEKISQFCGFSNIFSQFWSKFYFRLQTGLFLAEDKFCSQTEEDQRCQHAFIALWWWPVVTVYQEWLRWD